MPAPTVAITLPFPPPSRLADELSEDLGVHPHIDQGERAIDPTTPGIVVATALGLFLSGMIQQFGAEAANRLLRGFARLRRTARPGDAQAIRLLDEANDVVIVLGPQAMTEPAMAALLAQERDVFLPGVEFHWNPGTGRWQASHPDRPAEARD
jgi:hypothetical protein